MITQETKPVKTWGGFDLVITWLITWVNLIVILRGQKTIRT